MIELLKKLFNRTTPLPQATSVDPIRQSSKTQEADKFKNRGNILLAEGKLSEASQCYLQATQADPQDVFSFINLGYALSELQRFPEARSALEQALTLDRNQFDTYFMLGTIAQRQGQMSQAIERFQQVIKLNPDFELAYRELGYELFRAGKNAEAERVIVQGIERFAESRDLRWNLAQLYCLMNEPAKAIVICKEALLREPDNAASLAQLGVAFNQNGDTAKAREFLERSLAINPHDPDAQGNCGTVLWSQGLYTAAITHYELALALDPNHVTTHSNLALLCLLTGDYGCGWVEHEWRYRGEGTNKLEARKVFTRPLWLGDQSIHGKIILLHCEQGFGDTLQFCRYVPEVAALGATVILQVQRGLKQVLGGLSGASVVFEEGEELPYYDVHCPLMSLVFALGHHVRQIASDPAPYLFADTEKVRQWEEKLERMGIVKVPRIGVVSSGNPKHARDTERSLPLIDFVKMLPAGMEAIYLQPTVRHSDLPAVEAGVPIKFLGDGIDNFADTAALITVLDLVITVDTSVAHLAGALGKPVWILVTHTPDWRWQLGRDDSVWYGSARIFRQAAPKDWSVPLQLVHDALAQWRDGHSPLPEQVATAVPTITT
ncbi:MAG: tetratricopeptide repeat protein [Polaromonas sp.]